MGLFSSIKDKIMNIGKPKSNKTTTELQFDKAMNLMENANGEEAVEILERIAETGIVDPQYKELGMEALKILSGFYETGSYKNQNGDTVYTTDVVAEQLGFGESKGAADSNGSASGGKADFVPVPDSLTNDLPFK